MTYGLEVNLTGVFGDLSTVPLLRQVGLLDVSVSGTIVSNTVDLDLENVSDLNNGNFIMFSTAILTSGNFNDIESLYSAVNFQGFEPVLRVYNNIPTSIRLYYWGSSNVAGYSFRNEVYVMEF